MDLDKLLDKPLFRYLRNAVATIRAVAFLMTTAAGLAGLAYAATGTSPVRSGTTLAILIAVIIWTVTIAAGWIYIRRVANPTFYEITKLRATLVIQPAGDHHRYIYEHEQTVLATRDELRLIEFISHWTGASTMKPQVDSLNANHAILDGQQTEDDGRIRRWIYPRRPIDKGEQIGVGIRQTHEDDVTAQRTFFREGSRRYRIRKIVITVRFNSEDDPYSAGEVEGMIWNTHRSGDHYRTIGHPKRPERRVNHQNGTVDYTIVENKPRQYYSYGIRWAWPANHQHNQRQQPRRPTNTRATSSERTPAQTRNGQVQGIQGPGPRV